MKTDYIFIFNQIQQNPFISMITYHLNPALETMYTAFKGNIKINQRLEKIDGKLKALAIGQIFYLSE